MIGLEDRFLTHLDVMLSGTGQTGLRDVAGVGLELLEPDSVLEVWGLWLSGHNIFHTCIHQKEVWWLGFEWPQYFPYKYPPNFSPVKNYKYS